MAKSGIQHTVISVPASRSQVESEEFHAIVSGTSFPSSPVEKQLYYRDDLHRWYQYNGTGWIDLTVGSADVASAVATHAALTTGVHGVAAGTIVGTALTQTLTNKTLTSPLFNGLIDGWISVNETWAYASSTTITVPSGAASRYQPGDKIKLIQPTLGVKYFYVVGVADTVLTITAGTTYTLANEAISANYYSHEANPLGFPHWFVFTPTISGTTGSAGTFSQITFFARFAIIGRIVHVLAGTIATDLGSWTGDLQVQMPVIPSVNPIYSCNGLIVSAGTVTIEGISYYIDTATGVMVFFAAIMATVYPYSSLGVGDRIMINATYQL